MPRTPARPPEPRTHRPLVIALLSFVLVLSACAGDDSAIDTSDDGGEGAGAEAGASADGGDSDDLDSDGIPDGEDDDIDGDGFSNDEEGGGQVDTDGDGITDDRDRDSDGDGRFDIDEPRTDDDGDGAAARIDDDDDGDGVADGAETAGGGEDDSGQQAAPEPDDDVDSVPDDVDNCVDTKNPKQEDSDGDGVGDACDGCPDDPDRDTAPCETDNGGGGLASGEGEWCLGLTGGGGSPVFVPAAVSVDGAPASAGAAFIVGLDGFTEDVGGGCVNTGGGFGGPIFRCDQFGVGLGGAQMVGVYDDGIYFTFAGSEIPATIELSGEDCDESDVVSQGPSLALADLTELAAINHAELIATVPIDPGIAPEDLATQPEEAIRRLIDEHFTDLTALQLGAIEDELLAEAPAEQVPDLAAPAIAMLPPILLTQVEPNALAEAMGNQLNTLPDGYFQLLEPDAFRAFGIEATATLDGDLLAEVDLPGEFIGDDRIVVPAP